MMNTRYELILLVALVFPALSYSAEDTFIIKKTMVDTVRTACVEQLDLPEKELHSFCDCLADGVAKKFDEVGDGITDIIKDPNNEFYKGLVKTCSNTPAPKTQDSSSANESFLYKSSIESIAIQGVRINDDAEKAKKIFSLALENEKNKSIKILKKNKKKLKIDYEAFKCSEGTCVGMYSLRSSSNLENYYEGTIKSFTYKNKKVTEFSTLKFYRVDVFSKNSCGKILNKEIEEIRKNTGLKIKPSKGNLDAYIDRYIEIIGVNNGKYTVEMECKDGLFTKTIELEK